MTRPLCLALIGLIALTLLALWAVDSVAQETGWTFTMEGIEP